MGFEIEVKFRAVDHAELARRLVERGACLEGTVEHSDAYLGHPARDFATTGEAFRLRGEGSSNRITYKGPKLGGPAKTREEIEVDFTEGTEARDQLAVVFDRLGFRPVAVVRKTRTTYNLDHQGRPMTVTLDVADGLGSFAEVEALAATEADVAEAQAAVLALAGSMGLVEVEPRSYLRMLLESGLTGIRNPPGQT